MELHELDVGNRHARPERHGQPVGRRLRRVGGDGEELSGSAGGEHGVRGRAPRSGFRRRRAARTPRQRPSSTRRSRANHSSSTAAADARVASTRARSTSAPVAAPPACTTRAVEWPPSRASASAPPGCRSNTAPIAMSSWTRRGALVDQHPDGVGVAESGTGGQGVGEVEVGRVLVAAEHRRHAALGPPGGRLGELCLGQDADPEADGPPRTQTKGAARRIAAERPATPLPSTRTSSSERGRRRAIGAGATLGSAAGCGSRLSISRTGPTSLR